jgi:hypothetical protein
MIAEASRLARITRIRIKIRQKNPVSFAMVRNGDTS